MPHPVTIPAGTLTTTDAKIVYAESLLQKILQLAEYGSTGASVQVNTPALTVPQPNGKAPIPYAMTTTAEQIMLRNIALSIVDYVEGRLVGGAGNYADRETPTGVMTGTDGTNGLAVYTLAHSPLAGSLILVKTGMVMLETVDFTIAGSTITYLNPQKPIAGNDWHRAWYRY